jgi:hypothetical protein
MTGTRRKRPWLAAVLAFFPGVGHVYLREWFRATLWFGLVVSTFTLLLSESAVATLSGRVSADVLVAFAEQVPLEAWVALVAVTLLSMADAFWMATRENVESDVVEGATCPSCGMELDEDLEFCHWCTTRLDRPADDEE